MRKILYSPGYGAGWTSWEHNRKLAKYMVDYLPIIEYVENGGTFDDKNLELHGTGGTINETKLSKLPDCLKKFVKECQEKFGEVPYLSGLGKIRVKTVHGSVKISDHDGYESVKESDGEWL